MKRPVPKEYVEVKEAHDIIVKLRHRYHKMLRNVDPDEIIVMGVSNKSRPDHQPKLAVIHEMTPAYRAIFATLNRRLRYFIEVYCDDFASWSESRRQCVLLHELLHVPKPKSNGLRPHDVMEFGVLIDAFGLDWWTKDTIPDLLTGDPFPFKEYLFERLDQQGKEYDDDD